MKLSLVPQEREYFRLFSDFAATLDQAAQLLASAHERLRHPEERGARDDRARARRRQDRARHRQAPEQELRHAARPRGHLRPRLDPRRDPRQHRGDRRPACCSTASSSPRATPSSRPPCSPSRRPCCASPSTASRSARASTSTGSSSTASRTTATGCYRDAVAELFDGDMKLHRHHQVEGHLHDARGAPSTSARTSPTSSRASCSRTPDARRRLLVAIIAVALGLRLHQRLPRLGQRHRLLDLDARPVAARRAAHGRRASTCWAPSPARTWPRPWARAS